MFLHFHLHYLDLKHNLRILFHNIYIQHKYLHYMKHILMTYQHLHFHQILYRQNFDMLLNLMHEQKMYQEYDHLGLLHQLKYEQHHLKNNILALQTKELHQRQILLYLPNLNSLALHHLIKQLSF